jgi:adenylylsulfate kinase-like enzyme
VVYWAPGAGKSTIANLVEAGLNARGVHTIMLDGDNIRHGSIASSALPSPIGWKISGVSA